MHSTSPINTVLHYFASSPYTTPYFDPTEPLLFILTTLVFSHLYIQCICKYNLLPSNGLSTRLTLGILFSFVQREKEARGMVIPATLRQFLVADVRQPLPCSARIADDVKTLAAYGLPIKALYKLQYIHH